MRIYINAKQIHKKPRIAACCWEPERVPGDLRELIGMLVAEGVRSFNSRLREQEPRRVLSEAELEQMSQVGRIGFGIPFGSREADPAEALETAIRGFEDGLYRVFVGEREIASLDTPLQLREGDTITMIRLVMLTGGWF